MKITNVEAIDTGFEFGVYVWEMPDGRWVGDDDGNFLSISSARNDIERMSQLAQAVRSYGVNEGQPKFLEGARKITDEEYEEQVERMKEGKVPDPYDIPALMEQPSE